LPRGTGSETTLTADSQRRRWQRSSGAEPGHRAFLAASPVAGTACPGASAFSRPIGARCEGNVTSLRHHRKAEFNSSNW